MRHRPRPCNIHAARESRAVLEAATGSVLVWNILKSTAFPLVVKLVLQRPRCCGLHLLCSRSAHSARMALAGVRLVSRDHSVTSTVFSTMFIGMGCLAKAVKAEMLLRGRRVSSVLNCPVFVVVLCSTRSGGGGCSSSGSAAGLGSSWELGTSQTHDKERAVRGSPARPARGRPAPCPPAWGSREFGPRDGYDWTSIRRGKHFAHAPCHLPPPHSRFLIPGHTLDHVATHTTWRTNP